MKKTILPVAALAALSALAACNSEPETVTSNTFDPQAAALNSAAPVQNLRMIQASRTFRCKDNSLIYVDFYTDNTAAARLEKGAQPTVLTAADGKPPFVGEGWSISANDAQVSITAPGKGTQSCKA
ncbi:MAG TPA: hypothetical protein VGB70_00440 [Allosphingosinicella sp.]|jgi:curli biogenesis system outer membrane secretion channel CsgG